MSFLMPKVPKVPLPPNPANPAIDAGAAFANNDALSPAAGSLIATTARGLKRKASTQRTSLIGGG